MGPFCLSMSMQQEWEIYEQLKTTKAKWWRLKLSFPLPGSAITINGVEASVEAVSNWSWL